MSTNETSEWANVRIDRLERLADHLEHGKLGHDVFDFAWIHQRTTCGTVGCAIGELPFIEPDAWRFAHDRPNSVILADGDHETNTVAAGVWFGLSEDQAYHLFGPGSQEPERYHGRDLASDATRYQVAANLRAFIALARERQSRGARKRRSVA